MMIEAESTVLEEIAAVDPELATAMEYELIDADATAYADRIGMLDQSAPVPF